MAGGTVENILEYLKSNLNVKKKPTLKHVDATTPINASSDGGVQLIQIKPPTGEAWMIKNIRIDIKGAGTSGDHEIKIIFGGRDKWWDASVHCRWNYNDPAGISYNAYSLNGLDPTPADNQLLHDVLTSIPVTDVAPLTIRYRNSTNATTARNANISLIVEVLS